MVSQIRNAGFDRIINPDSNETEESNFQIKVTPELYLRATGMRVSGDTYPEEAKNREEWDLLEAAGWHECGNSRLLYKTYSDD